MTKKIKLSKGYIRYNFNVYLLLGQWAYGISEKTTWNHLLRREGGVCQKMIPSYVEGGGSKTPQNGYFCYFTRYEKGNNIISYIFFKSAIPFNHCRSYLINKTKYQVPKSIKEGYN